MLLPRVLACPRGHVRRMPRLMQCSCCAVNRRLFSSVRLFAIRLQRPQQAELLLLASRPPASLFPFRRGSRQGRFAASAAFPGFAEQITAAACRPKTFEIKAGNAKPSSEFSRLQVSVPDGAAQRLPVTAEQFRCFGQSENRFARRHAHALYTFPCPSLFLFVAIRRNSQLLSTLFLFSSVKSIIYFFRRL